jgi:hypothetical protein
VTIYSIALVVGCEKCPAFLFCSIITVLGNQEEKDEINQSNKVWEENFLTVDTHIDKMGDLKKNKNEESG